MARRQLELSNEVAAELAGAQDSILRTLEQHLDCEVFLRGNVVTLDGEAEAVQAGATVIRELSSLVERGHDIGPATIESVARVLDQSESPSTVLEDVVWRHRNLRVAPKSVNQKRYVDAIRRSTITFGIGPAGTGKTFLAIAMAVGRALAPRGQPHHPHPPGGRGRRAARLPAGRPDGEGRPVPAPAVRRAARHARPRARVRPPGEGRDRGRAAGLHARPHAQRLVRDPRRGAEHDARADEDVPHPARVRLEDGRHRRRHAGRPAARAAVGPAGGRRHPRGRRGRGLRALRRRGRRAPQAGAADRGRLRGARRSARRARAAAGRPRRRRPEAA